MLIGSKYRIEMIPLNVILYEKHKTATTDGVEDVIMEEDEGSLKGWDIVGYFSSIPSALKFMVDKDIQGLGLDDLKAIHDRQVELYTLIAFLSGNESFIKVCKVTL